MFLEKKEFEKNLNNENLLLVDKKTNWIIDGENIDYKYIKDYMFINYNDFIILSILKQNDDIKIFNIKNNQRENLNQFIENYDLNNRYKFNYTGNIEKSWLYYSLLSHIELIKQGYKFNLFFSDINKLNNPLIVIRHNGLIDITTNSNKEYDLSMYSHLVLHENEFILKRDLDFINKKKEQTSDLVIEAIFEDKNKIKALVFIKEKDKFEIIESNSINSMINTINLFNNFEILNKKLIFKNESEFNNYFENISQEKNTLNEMDR